MSLPFTRAQYLDKLTSQNGFHEGGGNGDGNLTPYGAMFGLNGQPWCAMLIGWAMEVLGFDIRSLSSDFYWTPSFYSQVKAAGWQDIAPGDIITGDIVFIDWNSDGQIDHVCTAVGSVEGGMLSTFDGNMSNQAGYFRKALGVIHSAVRPPYAVPAAPSSSAPAALTAASSVSLNHILVSVQVDGPAPTGYLDGFAPEVLAVEQALAAEGLLSGSLVDGSAGTSTFGHGSAYAAWQRRCGYSGAGADGYPGLASLTSLGAAHGFTVTA